MEGTMVWVALVAAGLLEVLGAVGLKYTEGFKKFGVTILVLVAFATSFFLLAAVAKVLPIGTAYAIWTGIGAAGTALFGMILLGEPKNAKRLFSLLLVIGGSVGMKLTS
jgi:quaternary ammonium compound-resistance protein SugE